MTDAVRDDNNITVGLGWDDTNSVTKPLLVDPSTGRLLIQQTIVDTSVPVLNSVKRDSNHIPSALVYDDTAVTPFLIDNRNGLLFCDVSVE